MEKNIPDDNFSSEQMKYEKQMKFLSKFGNGMARRANATDHVSHNNFHLRACKVFPYENIYRFGTCFDFLSAQQFRT